MFTCSVRLDQVSDVTLTCPARGTRSIDCAVTRRAGISTLELRQSRYNMKKITVLFIVPIAVSSRWEALADNMALPPQQKEVLVNVPVSILRDIGCGLTNDSIISPVGDEPVVILKEDADKFWTRYAPCDLTDIASPFDHDVTAEDVLAELKRLIRA